MHELHKILVRLNGHSPITADTREELIESVRAYAEEATESFYGEVFDWRETSTAGRWESEYPVNVIFSKDDFGGFIEELDKCAEYQKNFMQFLLGKICSVSSDIRELVEIGEDLPYLTSYYLHCLAELLYGEYTCNSGFYDTERGSSDITRAVVESVTASPDDWALVMFDCHI
ncbi:MAG: hypothetical protein J6Y20_07775 [Lachnospiraceae bacterium]|nr:hypothetical protein [Lachnospiraceae bacterium]